MHRPALYSRSSSSPDPAGSEAAAHAPALQDSLPDSGTPGQPQAPESPSAQNTLASANHLRLLWATVGLLALALAFSLFFSMQPPARRLTQKDINAAVLNTLQTTVLPSPGLKAYDAIIPSVVRVIGLSKATRGKDGSESAERSVGTGVVIVDKGVILTNLHVVQDAQTIRITFADGLESGASITGVQLDNDLAVLQAHKIPDDLAAATMRSTAGLAPGEQVMAVGYPFGIGPSASSGVISGLDRTFRSPEGKQIMSNLIQFDAAANPGNSGGPLVTMDGEVIGIVTAIYNPNQQKSFVGIGFAVPIESAAAAAGMPPF
ncbi:MAG: trypsin-like peptidase domain-containing protein [Polaromonas sp.]